MLQVNTNTNTKLAIPGILALDLDGTMLTEKIDKNVVHGLKNPDANLRQSLIATAQLASEQGWVIVIVTARPLFVEEGLEFARGRVGTKPTQDIVDELKMYGITVSAVYRQTHGGKGKTMTEIREHFSQYNPDVKCVLIDDQTKQTDSVNAIGHEHLKGVDVNSVEQMTDFYENTLGKTDDSIGFHPRGIVKDFKQSLKSAMSESEDQHTAPEVEKLKQVFKIATKELEVERYIGQEKVALTQDELKVYQSKATALTALHELSAKIIVLAADHANSGMIQLLQAIEDNLYYRTHEALYRGYSPELEWVENSASTLLNLADKFFAGRVIEKDMAEASKRVFKKANFLNAKPNSECEKLIKKFFESVSILPNIANLRQQCQAYLAHLDNPGTNPDYLLNPIDNIKSFIAGASNGRYRLHSRVDKQLAMGILIGILDDNEASPVQKLQNFTKTLEQQKAILVRSRHENVWYSGIRDTLAKIPIFGRLFRTTGRNFTDSLKKNWPDDIQSNIASIEPAGDKPSMGMK